MTFQPAIDHLGQTALKLVGTDANNESQEVFFNVDVILVTSIEQSNLDQYVQISPNPSSGVFQIDLSALSARGYSYQLTSPSTGKQIVQSEIINKAQLLLDLSAYPKGLYLFEARSENKRVVKKLLVIK